MNWAAIAGLLRLDLMPLKIGLLGWRVWRHSRRKRHKDRSVLASRPPWLQSWRARLKKCDGYCRGLRFAPHLNPALTLSVLVAICDRMQARLLRLEGYLLMPIS